MAALEHEAAIPLLHEALRLEQTRKSKRAELWVDLGICQVTIGDEAAARQSFAEALAADAAASVPPNQSPKIVQLFEETRERARAARRGDSGVRAASVVRTDKPVELSALRLRYAAGYRVGSQTDSGQPISYRGPSFSTVGLEGAYFGRATFGLRAGLERDAFQLGFASGPRKVAPVRGSLSAAARGTFGRFALEGGAGYGVAELPSFQATPPWRAEPAWRHAVLLSGRGRVELPWGSLAELSAEVPIAVAARAPGGNGSAQGLSAGLGLLFPLGDFERLKYALGIDYRFVWDRFVSGGGRTATQARSLFGVGLELAWLSARPLPPPPQRGSLFLTLLDEETGAPVAGARARVETSEEVLTVTTGADGTALVTALKPGRLDARISEEHYEPLATSTVVVAGEQASARLRLKSKPATTGDLVLILTDVDTGQAVPGAKVRAAATEHAVGADGVQLLSKLAPGPTRILVTAPGYLPTDLVGQVVVGKKASVAVHLRKVAKATQGVVRGKVFSANDGQPLEAVLRLQHSEVELKTDAAGAFELPLENGTYRLVISAKGHRPQTKTVKVREGETTIFNVGLLPATPRGR
jgi:hypothetical protein